jgi:pimeloyl-ACP methyl ester carboxylesterase
MVGRVQRRTENGTSFLTGGAGPPVVLLHGIPGSALTWEAVAGRMVDQYRVVVPDRHGFGQSEPPVGDDYMAGQARAITELLDALGIGECSLVTHDFGGPVGLTVMGLFPDLSVPELVLSSTNVFTDTSVPPPLRVAKIPVLNTLAFQLLVGNRFGM